MSCESKQPRMDPNANANDISESCKNEANADAAAPIPAGIIPEDMVQLMVTCVTNDGDVQVEAGLLQQCTTFCQWWKEMCISDDKTLLNKPEYKFLIREVSPNIFMKAADWMRLHVGVAVPEMNEDPVTHEVIFFNLTKEEKEFFEVPIEILGELIQAANFLDLQSLYLYSCQTLAGIIMGKNDPTEVLDILGMQCDFSAEEKEAKRKDYAWVFY